MSSLFNNGVRYYLGGHDHMHNRALVTSPDGFSTVQNIITASDSYKFYIPQNPSNDAKYNIPANGITNGPREMEISQELFKIGYYVVTVDGPRVTVDYYASPNGCAGDCDLTYDIIPYTFTKHETFGYSFPGESVGVVGDAGGLPDKEGIKLSESGVILLPDHFCCESEGFGSPDEPLKRLRV
jgi:hypothetical protein